MTLAELSVCYEEAAVPLRRRLRELRLLLAATEGGAYADSDPAERAGGADGSLLRQGVLPE